MTQRVAVLAALLASTVAQSGASAAEPRTRGVGVESSAVVPSRKPVVGPVPAAPTQATAEESSAPRWRSALGIGAMVVGAAAVGSGIYALARDGKRDCDDPVCPRVYPKTAVSGWVQTGLGGATMVGGVLLFPWSSSITTTVTFVPSGLWLRGAF